MKQILPNTEAPKCHGEKNITSAHYLVTSAHWLLSSAQTSAH